MKFTFWDLMIVYTLVRIPAKPWALYLVECNSFDYKIEKREGGKDHCILRTVPMNYLKSVLFILIKSISKNMGLPQHRNK